MRLGDGGCLRERSGQKQVRKAIAIVTRDIAGVEITLDLGKPERAPVVEARQSRFGPTGKSLGQRDRLLPDGSRDCFLASAIGILAF